MSDGLSDGERVGEGERVSEGAGRRLRNAKVDAIICCGLSLVDQTDVLSRVTVL